jgi:hypothetical protein
MLRDAFATLCLRCFDGHRSVAVVYSGATHVSKVTIESAPGQLGHGHGP